MAILTLRNLSLSYGDPPLIDGIDLAVEAGERICLLGRNGEGKSTLLRQIAGDLKADDGERVLSQAIRVARLTQEVPEQLHGSVFEVVADGVGATAELIKQYHAATHEQFLFQRIRSLFRSGPLFASIGACSVCSGRLGVAYVPLCACLCYFRL